MKIIDEKGKLFGIINVIDLLLLLIILAIVVGVGYKLVVKNEGLFQSGKAETKDYKVTIYCPMSPAAAAQHLKVGDKIYYDSYGELEAVVESVNSDSSIRGELPSNYPNIENITIVLKVSSSAADKRIMMGGIQLNIGKEVMVKTYRVEITGYVIGIAE